MDSILISFVGIDGSGKSTQSNRLRNFLSSKKEKVILLRSSMLVKSIFHESQDIYDKIKEFDDLSATFFWAFISRELSRKVNSYLRSDYIVILDRWDETFLAHNLFFGELAKHNEIVLTFNLLIFQDILPDITFYLDISPEVAMTRLFARNRSDKPKNTEKSISLEINKNFYGDLCTKRKWVKINADTSEEEIFSQVLERLSEYLEK